MTSKLVGGGGGGEGVVVLILLYGLCSKICPFLAVDICPLFSISKKLNTGNLT